MPDAAPAREAGFAGAGRSRRAEDGSESGRGEDSGRVSSGSLGRSTGGGDCAGVGDVALAPVAPLVSSKLGSAGVSGPFASGSVAVAGTSAVVGRNKPVPK